MIKMVAVGDDDDGGGSNDEDIRAGTYFALTVAKLCSKCFRNISFNLHHNRMREALLLSPLCGRGNFSRHKCCTVKVKQEVGSRVIAELSRPRSSILACSLLSHPLHELQDSWVILGFLPVTPTLPICREFSHWLSRPLLWSAFFPRILGLTLGPRC